MTTHRFSHTLCWNDSKTNKKILCSFPPCYFETLIRINIYTETRLSCVSKCIFPACSHISKLVRCDLFVDGVNPSSSAITMAPTHFWCLQILFTAKIHCFSHGFYDNTYGASQVQLLTPTTIVCFKCRLRIHIDRQL